MELAGNNGVGVRFNDGSDLARRDSTDDVALRIGSRVVMGSDADDSMLDVADGWTDVWEADSRLPASLSLSPRALPVSILVTLKLSDRGFVYPPLDYHHQENEIQVSRNGMASKESTSITSRASGLGAVS